MQNGGGSGVTGSDEKYYVGRTGVEAEFKNLPNKVYYYEDDANNEFSFGVKVQNEGTSLSRGAIFISGYDPNFIEIEGLEIPESAIGDCTFDINAFGDQFNQWVGTFECLGIDISIRNGYWNANIATIGELIGWDWLGDISIGGFNDNITSGGFSLNIEGDHTDFDMTIMYHGLGLVLIMSPMTFESYLGTEYFLEADDSRYPGGGQDFLDYHVFMKSWPPGLDELNTEILMTNCYGYATYASPLVCIDSSPNTEHEKVCKPGTISLSNQGAPVAVTKIEQETTRKKSIFTIYVKNIGTGDIIDFGYLERCSPYYPGALLSKHKNVLQAFNVRIEDRLLECNPEDGRVRLDQDGTGTIVCTYNHEFVNVQSAYETPLIIEFWYGYQKTDRENIIFKKV